MFTSVKPDKFDNRNLNKIVKVQEGDNVRNFNTTSRDQVLPEPDCPREGWRGPTRSRQGLRENSSNPAPGGAWRRSETGFQP